MTRPWYETYETPPNLPPDVRVHHAFDEALSSMCAHTYENGFRCSLVEERHYTEPKPSDHPLRRWFARRR